MNRQYKARTEKQIYNNIARYYPVIEFTFKGISDNYYINEPQETRSKALTIAKNHIKNLK